MFIESGISHDRFNFLNNRFNLSKILFFSDIIDFDNAISKALTMPMATHYP